MAEQVLLSHLRSCADAYCRARGMSLSTVAQRVLGDWRFFDKTKEGKTFTVRKYDKAMAWFSANWPEGSPWPAEVPRPALPLKRSRKAA